MRLQTGNRHPATPGLRAAVALLLAGLVAAAPAEACTRLVYHGAGGQVITARSMAWKSDVATNLWVFPRGMKRTGEVGPNSIEWTSRYGSVVASGYDVSTTDGMNEAGLAANVLWLVESDYPAFDGSKPGLTLAAWAQYALDNFATVDEAVSDSSGDSAIVEYIGGRQVIHHGRQYNVMTNSPTFDEQLALDSYWKGIGGTVFLPGTNHAADRFARASFYVDAVPKDENPNRALASVFGIIRNVSVPFGLTTPEEPNISSTRWRTVVDHARKLYFFESALTPNTFWVDLKQIDFTAETGRVLKLDLGPDQDHTFAGNATAAFEPAEPFRFLGL